MLIRSWTGTDMMYPGAHCWCDVSRGFAVYVGYMIAAFLGTYQIRFMTLLPSLGVEPSEKLTGLTIRRQFVLIG